MTPRQRLRMIDWIGIALFAVAVLNGMWTAGQQ